MSASLRLKPNANARVLRGHPWVFANEVAALLPPGHDGEVVECRDARGRLLGTGIYNSRSQILWRRLGRGRTALDEAYLREALVRAVARRDATGSALPATLSAVASAEAEGPPTAGRLRPEAPARQGDHALHYRRLVWSESDDLPGVVVDQFGDALVLQVQTLAMDRRQAALVALLDEIVRPAEIIVRNDASIRRLEGLPLAVSTRSGRPWEPRWAKIDGIEYWLDLEGGQKTGFYLDQRRQHSAVAAYARGRRVLDAFCNQGPFALHCARAGAAGVRALDTAEEAIAQGRRNAERNGLSVEFVAVNVFDYFGERRDEAWDLIILDPPPFAKSKGALAGAMRGYKEINLRAMQRLAPGGVLATYSCSHHVQDADFRGMLAEAATDAKRSVRVLEFCHQPPDHPVLATMPESEYLRGYVLAVD